MKNYKLTVRTVTESEIGRFSVAEDQTMQAQATAELARAWADKRLDAMATRVGLPAIAVSEVDGDRNLSGSENVVSVALFAPNGDRIDQRSYRVEASGAHYLAIAVDGDDEKPIGAFESDEVATQVARFWRNGHLEL